ncbi:MAG: Rrf2 family transcriptional regulator [Clostridiales bacterium]|uniref:RrF2 family transcriptional regulator n=1 Tax=Evtepia sp. TaxID=2773933 RepID=UPI002985C223|nr:Rrf2 family transcriptional regulator [Evtepia sp.]MDD7290077.1 Rrf2 family transcriptional regulator [Clostridiales bacterium]MDY4429421.1 Rrf2 family transcriptional regulator [Evtepia sp.]
MMISTKGRYALRVMLDLADHNTGEYIPLKDIAHRQEISVKYLENILASLSRVNLVDAARGKGGGYRLAKTPADYSAGEIIRLAEGSLASVSCLKGEKKGCEKAGHCRALPLWQGLDQMIDQYLDSYSLADLQKQQAELDAAEAAEAP